MTHTPTSTGKPNHTPTTCFVCGRRATSIGMEGFGWNGDHDPHWICEACIPLLQQIKAVRSWDVYEQNAIAAAVDGVGDMVERFGADLSAWSEEQAHEFAGSIILGFGDSIRKQVKESEVPF